MNYSSSYSAAFLKLLPNVDLTQSVRIIPTMKEEDGKKKPGLFITQHGTPLKHYYTKDNPNGLPQMVKRRVKEQGRMVEKWDDNDMMEFLENMVNTLIKPNLNKSGVPMNVEEEKEKLPF